MILLMFLPVYIILYLDLFMFNLVIVLWALVYIHLASYISQSNMATDMMKKSPVATCIYIHVY